MELIPVPPIIQRRAWDAAWALSQDFGHRLTHPQSTRMAAICLKSPDRLGWAECGDALVVWNIIVVIRT